MLGLNALHSPLQLKSGNIQLYIVRVAMKEDIKVIHYRENCSFTYSIQILNLFPRKILFPLSPSEGLLNYATCWINIVKAVFHCYRFWLSSVPVVLWMPSCWVSRTFAREKETYGTVLECFASALFFHPFQKPFVWDFFPPLSPDGEPIPTV